MARSPSAVGRDDVGRRGGLQHALGQPAVAALLGDAHQAVGLERAEVVVDLLAREADLRGQRGGRAGLGQLGQQPRADRVERDRGGGRILDHLDVVHASMTALTNFLVKLRCVAMRIVLAGGTGQIGRVLARAFAGDEVVVLARAAGRSRWDGRTLGPWAAALEGADALINLAGRSVDCRYTAANRHAIMDSRIASTRVLREALSSVPPTRRRCGCSRARRRSTPTPTGPPHDEAHGVLGGVEPRLPRHLAVLDRRRARVGGGGGRRAGAHRAHALGDGDEPGPRRRVRHAARRSSGAGSAAARARAPVRLLDPRDRLRARGPAADRARGPLRPGQPRRRPNPLPYARVHARAARGGRRALRAAGDALDARGGRVRPAHRDRAGAEEPARRARPPARGRLRVRAPGLAARPRATSSAAIRSAERGDRRVARSPRAPRPAPRRDRRRGTASASGRAARRSRRSGSGRARAGRAWAGSAPSSAA